MNLKLRNRRKELKLRQAQVASHAGISLRQYQKFEYGENSPKFITAFKIAQILNLPAEELFGDPEHADYNISAKKENVCKHEENLNEGVRVVNVIHRAAQIIACSSRVSRLMADIGKNGQVNSEEFRPVFEELREVVNGAFV